VAAAALLGAATPIRAQLPGLPVAPNAFVRPGVAAAVNVGRTEDRTTVGLALGYGNGSRLFAVTSGAALFDGRDFGGKRREAAWGVRGLVRGLTLLGGRAAVSPFLGVGGVTLHSTAPGAADEEITQDLLAVPAGVVASYRMRLGEQRVLSASVAPFYSYNRLTASGDQISGAVLRLSASIDVAVTRRAGVTLAWEGGAAAAPDEPGPRRSLLGLGFSFGFGGPR
jgi:hypothetical protein